MTIADLTFTSFQLAKLIDGGGFGKSTAQRVKDELELGDLFWFLDRTFPGELDFSIFDGTRKREEIGALWLDLAVEDTERPWLGVENDGLCLLLAMCIEGIQRLAAMKPVDQYPNP